MANKTDVGIVLTIIGIALTILFGLYGNNLINEGSPSSGNSQTKPPATATTPTQESTITAPSHSSGNSNDDIDNENNPISTPTPTPTITPSPAPETPPIELTFGESVSGSLITTTNSIKYTVVLPSPGRLTLSVARDRDLGPLYLSIRLFDSNGVRIGGKDNQYLGGAMVSFNYDYVLTLDLEASTYDIEIAKQSGSVTIGPTTGVFYLRVDFVPF